MTKNKNFIFNINKRGKKACGDYEDHFTGWIFIDGKDGRWLEVEDGDGNHYYIQNKKPTADDNPF